MQLDMPFHSTGCVKRSDEQGDDKNICLANLVCGFMAMGGLHPVWLSSVPIILDSRNSFFLTSGSQQHRMMATYSHYLYAYVIM